MRRLIAGLLGALLALPAAAQGVVDASAPVGRSVTIYRDPDRAADESMNRDWPKGFALITERRQVTLPRGRSTVRFTGVAEGMVAVSAIVTGLPGGPVEQNRDADLLGPAALVDGTLGNRVTLTRTDPATGQERPEPAIVRSRADGGLVLQTAAGFEAVRCSGLPERLSFAQVPDGLSPEPVFSTEVTVAGGGMYDVALTYLAWGFDWQAHHVATLRDGAAAEPGAVTLDLTSWLTLLNDNGQSFADAELLVVAGTLNVTSDFRQLASPPQARPLQLACYPLGSTAAGSAIAEDMGVFPPMMVAGMAPPPPPPPPPAPEMSDVIVTGSRIALQAEEEELGALRLYRVPEPITVAAKGQKQVAFLQRDDVAAALVYQGTCLPGYEDDEARPMSMRLETVNDAAHGLGAALPAGGVTLFEPSARGELLVGEESLPDRAAGQRVELSLAESSQLFLTCRMARGGRRSQRMEATLSNAGDGPARVRVQLYAPRLGRVSGLRDVEVRDGMNVVEVALPAGGRRTLAWTIRPAQAE